MIHRVLRCSFAMGNTKRHAYRIGCKIKKLSARKTLENNFNYKSVMITPLFLGGIFARTVHLLFQLGPCKTCCHTYLHNIITTLLDEEEAQIPCVA